MPTQPPPSSPDEVRGVYARTNGNMLVGGPDGVDPASESPTMWWWGLDSGGGAYPIGPNGPWAATAAGLPVVIRATSLITGPLTAAPFRQVDLADGHPLGRARWITDPMLLRDDARFPGSVYPAVSKLPRGEFFAEWIRGALWWGVGAFLCQDDETGQPIPGTLRNVDSRLLSTMRDPDGPLVWVLESGGLYDGQVMFDRDGRLTLGEVTYRLVVLRNPHSPVGVDGHSAGVFELAPSAFQMAGQIEDYASGQFRSGVPNGVLQVSTPGLTQTQADELKSKWMTAHGNDRRSIAVLNAVTSFQPFNLSPVDAALDQVKRLNIADCAYAFGLDPMTLGAGLNNSATYTNLRDAWQNHRDFGLAPWIATVQDTLSALLPGSQGVQVNLDGFANPPLKERVETGSAAVAAGLMTVDEWRALEGLPPIGGTG
jgi:HK97 family phage portal protein